MYLHGFGVGGLGLPANVQAQANLCTAGGGVPRLWYSASDTNRSPIDSSAVYQGCDYPPQQVQPVYSSAAPVTVTVPTNVYTQVSPQISPQFIQQQSPQNSPIDAGGATHIPTFDPSTVQAFQRMAEENARPPAWLEALSDAMAASAPQPDQYASVPAPPLDDGTTTPAAPVSFLQQVPNMAWVALAALGMIFVIRANK